MEEDLKVLEKYVEKDIPCNSCKYCAERPKVAGALRNLIKGYKELEEKNKKLEDYILKYYDDMQKEFNGLINHKFLDYIPKSLVKQKIEEMEKKQVLHSRYGEIKVLQELLQEGDDK